MYKVEEVDEKQVWSNCGQWSILVLILNNLYLVDSVNHVIDIIEVDK